MNSRLSPDRFRSYLERVELPLRSATHPEFTARRVLRYGSFVGSVIEHHVRLERTMIAARKRIQAVEQEGGSVASGTVILADSLSGSRGRFTRSWHAPLGGALGQSHLCQHPAASLPAAGSTGGRSGLLRGGAGEWLRKGRDPLGE